MENFKNNGWIKLHRKIFENPFYFSEKFTRCQAWIDLLLLANFSDGFFYKRGIKVEVKRGQIGYDLDSLGSRWKWSRGKVERFINDLEIEKQIVRQKTNVTTLITVINYTIYQSDDKADDKADGHQTVKQTEANKKDKKEKKDKKIEIYDDVKSSYSKCIDIYNSFILKQTTVKPILNSKQGVSMKLIINYLHDNTKDKPPTNESIYNGLNYIFNNYDKWSVFQKSNMDLCFIHSKIVDIINSIKKNKPVEKELECTR